jgi:hypothetical protein
MEYNFKCGVKPKLEKRASLKAQDNLKRVAGPA